LLHKSLADVTKELESIVFALWSENFYQQKLSDLFLSQAIPSWPFF